MKDVVRVIEQDDSKKKTRIRVLFPLGLKAFIVLVLTLLPMTLVLGLGAYQWSQGDLSPLEVQLLSRQLSVFHYVIPASCLVILALAVLGMCLGFLLLEHFFIRPTRLLLMWLREARGTDFTQVSVLPPMPHDDFGELGRLLASSTAYFSETKDQNTVLMREKTLFMTIAAHQLRTPLTGLLWSIESLLDPKADPNARPKLMMDIDRLLKRMRLIINQLLASANVEGGRFGYVFEQIDIVPIIEKLIEEFKPVSDDHGVSITFEHAEDAFPVYVDQERITVALFDLIENAIDYTPKGGTITVSVTPNGKQLEIAISDTGIGISEVEISSLFTKFYRSQRARRMRPDGSGLGLFLVKNIIASHGSDITVTSKEGSGSRFSFLLNSEKKQ